MDDDNFIQTEDGNEPKAIGKVFIILMGRGGELRELSTIMAGGQIEIGGGG